MSASQKGSLSILILVLVVILVTGLALLNPFGQKPLFGTADKKNTSQDDSVSLLFVNQSQSGSLVPIIGKDDMWTLSLTDVDNQVLWFSDKPERKTGWMPISKYINSWSSFGFTSQSPPNAAIVVDPKIHGLKDGSLVVSLTDPIYEAKNKTLTFTVTLLKSEPTKGLSHYKNSPNKTLPLHLQNPKLFIDNGIGDGTSGRSLGWGDGVDGN